MVSKAAVKSLAGLSGEQMAQALIAQGWTWDQVRAQYPELFGAGGPTIPGLETRLITTGPIGSGQPGDVPKMEALAGGAGLGDLLGDITQGGVNLPAGVVALLSGLGIGAGTISALGVGYGITQMMGVQYPWETGPGEGFIAPWSRDIVQDEGGRWVTRETRPDLFANGGAGAVVPMAGAGMMGVGIAKQWSANGWPFVMTTDGYIHTVTKSGLRKRWKPYKSVVLGKNPSPRMLNRAVTKLVQFDKLHSRIQKMARRIKT